MFRDISATFFCQVLIFAKVCAKIMIDLYAVCMSFSCGLVAVHLNVEFISVSLTYSWVY